MALVVVCPSCKQKLTFPEQFAGREVQCPGCMSDVKVTGEHRVPDAPAKPATAKPAPTKPAGAATPSAVVSKPQPTPRPAGASAIKKPVPPASVPPGAMKRAAPPRQTVPMDEISIEDDDGVIGFDSPHRPARGSGGKGVLIAVVAVLLVAGLGVGGFFLTQALLQDDAGDAHARVEKDKDFKDTDAKDKDDKDKDAIDKDGKFDDKKGEVPVAVPPVKDPVPPIPDSTDVAKVDPAKKEMGKDPVPPVPVKRGLPTSRDYRLTLVGKTTPFNDGFERNGNYYLFKEGHEMVVWNKGKTTTYNLGAGTPHVVAFDVSNELLYALVPADKPGVDARGRFVYDEPNLYCYAMREVLSGSALPGAPLMPSCTVKLLGKVAELKCNGVHLVYLDIADPMKPCLRKLNPGSLKETFTLTTFPNTVVFGISDAHEYVFATKEGLAALYDTTKKEVLTRHSLKMEPFDMLVEPRTTEVLASGRQGADSLLLVSQFASRRPSERAITGFPAQMRLRARGGITFGSEGGADSTKLFLFHTILNDSTGRPGYVEIESTGGPSRGVVVFGEDFAILDNGDVFAITRGDGPVAMLDPKKDMPKFPFPDPKKDPPFGKFPIRPKFPPVFPPGGGIGGIGGMEEKIVLTGKIDPFLGGWIDVDNKSAIFTHNKSGVKVYSYPDFKPKSTWRLPGTAQRVEFDREKGLMYALVPNLKAKDPYGKRGASQVIVFNAREAMTAVGKSTGKESLTEVRTMALPGYSTQICISADGESLYLLENIYGKSARVVRVGAEKGDERGAVPVHEFSDGLLLSPDGKTLYAISHNVNRSISRPGSVTGKLHVIDAMEMKLRDAIDVPICPNDIEATGEGIVFLAGYGPGKTDIVIVDSNRKENAVLTTWKGVPGGCCLKLDHAGRRLFVRSTKGAPTSVAAWPLPADFADTDLPRVTWSLGLPTSSRGDFFLAPDGRYILCESGQVFLIGNPDGLGGGLGGLGGFGGFPAP